MSSVTFPKKTIYDVPLEGRKILLRVDYNVPMSDKGVIRDDYRIRQSLPTIQYLLDQGCTLVLVSHLGQPKGRDERYSLEPVGERLAELLGKSVRFVDRVVGDKVRMATKRAPEGSITLLENVRFDSRELKNDDAMARQLVSDTGVDFIVQDAFGVLHRAHTTTEAIMRHAPGVAGLLVEREFIALRQAVENPQRPLIAVVGGAKIKDKISILKAFIATADRIIIGGAMANSFLAYQGYNMQDSLVDDGQTKTLDGIYEQARAKTSGDVSEFVVLPTDVVVAKEVDTQEGLRTTSVEGLHEGDKAFDIGPRSTARMQKLVEKAGTVIWNGTLGTAEHEAFSHGSAGLADVLINGSMKSIIGGGDTADFARGYNTQKGAGFSHVSTGGGAGLVLMSGEPMPGLESLLDAKA